MINNILVNFELIGGSIKRSEQIYPVIDLSLRWSKILHSAIFDVNLLYCLDRHI